MRIFKWIILGVVALLIIGVIIVYVSLNSIVRRTVQAQATNSLGVQTTLGSANVSILSSNLGLRDLEIASPQGFSAPKMFTLGGTDVDVSIGQLRKDPIHVDSITIKKPTLVVEQSNGKFNFKALMDQMPSTPEQQPSKQEGEPIKLIIDKLSVADGQVIIRPGLDLPNVPKEINVPLPGIALEHVGSGEGNQNGAALKEVVMQVITTMAAKASESDKLPPELKQLMSLDVNAVKAHLSQQINEQLNKVAGDITKKLPANIQGAATQFTKDPKALMKEPGKALDQNLGGLLDAAKNKRPPATKP